MRPSAKRWPPSRAWAVASPRQANSPCRPRMAAAPSPSSTTTVTIRWKWPPRWPRARLARPPHCAGVPAAPLHAHPRLLRGFRARAGNGRRRAAHRGVRRGRAAAGGRRRPSPVARAAGGGQGRTGVRGRRGGTAAGGPGFRAGRRRGDRDGRGVDQQGPGKWENWHERAIRQGGCAVWRPFRRAGRVADVGRGRAAGAELGRR